MHISRTVAIGNDSAVLPGAVAWANYKDALFAYYPSTDPQVYLASLEKIVVLPVKKVLPAHHGLDIQLL